MYSRSLIQELHILSLLSLIYCIYYKILFNNVNLNVVNNELLSLQVYARVDKRPRVVRLTLLNQQVKGIQYIPCPVNSS